jgi:AraC-like DNA-binding protein
VKGFTKIEEAERPIRTILQRLSATFHQQKNKKESHKLILQIKQYIESHYDNPELSLNHISEIFSLHMKTVSRLFKEVFGEDFVDYVAKVRMEEAKRLLVGETPDSVQDIARKVGYTHAITFIRVFKKWVGTTPGDYRKNESGILNTSNEENPLLRIRSIMSLYGIAKRKAKTVIRREADNGFWRFQRNMVYPQQSYLLSGNRVVPTVWIVSGSIRIAERRTKRWE